jgi:hypothetical protein
VLKLADVDAPVVGGDDVLVRGRPMERRDR